MENTIKGLEPKLLWKHFYNISQIPRRSKNEKKIREYIVNVAREYGLEYKIDGIGNLVVKKPATAGQGNKPAIVLQGHLDMVCEKNKDVAHDFDNDPIEIRRDGDWIRAKGTTLGADNGIGVAAALAVMEGTEINHGPLEFLFTVDEETGLTGAVDLDDDMLDGRILLNLDSEEDGVIYNGCAGGSDTELLFKAEFESIPDGFKPVLIKLTGLTGGHSGLNIHEGRGNAIKLLNRFLWDVLPEVKGRLSNIEGGSKHNAIPREADATVFLGNENIAKLKKMVGEFDDILKHEYKNIDPHIKFSIDESGFAVQDGVLTYDLQNRLVNLLYSIPHGAITMSNVMPSVVETSNNLAVIGCKAGHINILTSQRSMSKTRLIDIHNMGKACGYQAGAEVKCGTGYPPWQPDRESVLLKKACGLYQTLFNTEPGVKAIHAGLECGIIGDKFPGMDMISFGPTIMGAHSPDERVLISTMDKFWRFLVLLLNSL